jgi:hypothetical protein
MQPDLPQSDAAYQSAGSDDGLPAGDPDPAHSLAAGDVRESVLAALATLPEHERTVVQLFYFQGFSLTEIADRLGLPTTTIKKRLQYARDRLRQRLVNAQGAGVLRWQRLGDELAESTSAVCSLWRLPLLVPAPALAFCPALRQVDPRLRYAGR